MVQVPIKLLIKTDAVQIWHENGLRRITELTSGQIKFLQEWGLKFMKEEAPERTGKLRKGIKLEPPKITSLGNYDKRATIKIASTAPYSHFVITGAQASIGNGKKGTGRFVGNSPTFTRGAKNFKPIEITYTSRNMHRKRLSKKQKALGYKLQFRSRWGRWPGFKANDFITRSRGKLENKFRKVGVYEFTKIMTKSYGHGNTKI